MKNKFKNNLFVSSILWIAFIAYTVSVKFIDVANVGNKLSPVGFSSLNQFFFDLIIHSGNGVSTNAFENPTINLTCYNISEILGYFAIIVAVFFVFFGFFQLVKNKSFKKVNKNVYALGGFYACVMAFYVLFEVIIINYRPFLDTESGELEASYPSSHTLLTLCILTSAIIVLNYIFKNVKKSVYYTVSAILFVIMIATVITRLFSGVHWFTDILGGVLLSAALLMSFKTVVDKINQ